MITMQLSTTMAKIIIKKQKRTLLPPEENKYPKPHG
jgi:hypothetical protein